MVLRDPHAQHANRLRAERYARDARPLTDRLREVLRGEFSPCPKCGHDRSMRDVCRTILAATPGAEDKLSVETMLARATRFLAGGNIRSDVLDLLWRWMEIEMLDFKPWEEDKDAR